MLKKISAFEELSGCYRKEYLWSSLIDYSFYKEIISQIDTIIIHEQHPHFCRTEWAVMLGGAPFSWTELDMLQHDRYIINFEAINGDFRSLQGHWKIEDNKTDGGVRLTCAIEYDLGIPVVDENLADIMNEKMSIFVSSMVNGQARCLKRNIKNERRFKRVAVNREYTIPINGHPIKALVADFSRGGIKLTADSDVITPDSHDNLYIQLPGFSAKGFIFYSSYHRDYRLKFSAPISEENFRALFNNWAEGEEFTDDMIRIYDVVAPTHYMFNHHFAGISND